MNIGSLVKVSEQYINGNRQFKGKTGTIIDICDIMNPATGEMLLGYCYVFWPELDGKSVSPLDMLESLE